MPRRIPTKIVQQSAPTARLRGVNGASQWFYGWSMAVERMNSARVQKQPMVTDEFLLTCAAAYGQDWAAGVCGYMLALSHDVLMAQHDARRLARDVSKKPAPRG